MIQSIKKKGWNVNSLSYILNRLGHKKVLTRDEVRDLIEKHRSGDEKAGLAIIEHNIRLVLTISLYYVKRYNLEYDDIIGYGIIGLYNARRKFDPDRGYTFSTYASRWIKQAICRFALFRQDVVNIKEWRSHNGRLEFEFIDDDKEWKDIERCCYIENNNDKIYLQEKIADYIDSLDDRTRKIIIMKFGFNQEKGEMTLRAIGKEVNLTAERVRQIIQSQIRSMRRKKVIRALRDR